MDNILYLNFPIILTNMLSFDSAIYFKTKLFCFLLLSLDEAFFIGISYRTSQPFCSTPHPETTDYILLTNLNTFLLSCNTEAATGGDP